MRLFVALSKPTTNLALPDERNGDRVLVVDAVFCLDEGQDGEDQREHSDGNNNEDSDEDEGENKTNDVGDDHRQVKVQRTLQVAVGKSTSVLVHEPENER